MNEFKCELTQHILPFWIKRMVDEQNDGFFGRIDGNNHLHPKSPRGIVLNTRILWTFSAAYRLVGDVQYAAMAHRAFSYICDYFIDPIYGGVFWELDYMGQPINRKKQTYAQGFALYGFSEYYRATGNPKALELAKSIFWLIEKHKDTQCGGYFEAFTQEWHPIQDMRLSDKDANEQKSMNTHLHILEPYTNLLRIWRDIELEKAQKELINIFLTHILDCQTNHLNLFFDEHWNVKSSSISFGHDIEASWLLYEAAEVLSDKKTLKIVKPISLRIAQSALSGIRDDGGMIYEKENEKEDRDRHWWVQAEAVVGFMYAYKNSGEILFKNTAEDVWRYITNQIVDRQQGEWFWSRGEDGLVNSENDKAGFWKCPYHNSRMCMEMMEHFT